MTKSIIQIVPTIHNEASGPSYSVVRLTESLLGTRENVKLITLANKSLSKQEEYLHTFEPGLGPTRIGRSPTMKQWLLGEARRNKCSILHTHGIWMMPNVYPGTIARTHGTKLIVSPRGTMSKWAMRNSYLKKKVFWTLLQKAALRSASAFHATAESEFEDIRRLGFKQPVAIIPNGIDIPIDQPKSRKRHTLLFLSRIHPKKGVPNLLNAWSQIEANFLNWDLVIAGPDGGRHEAELKTLARSLDLKRCYFSGPYYGEKKLQLYQDADLFVLPTHSENFGMTVAESLAAGTPAIVTKGAPWSNLETESAGWWIDIGVEPLRKALCAAMSLSTEERTAMGQNGRTWMVRDFSWQKIAQDMNAFYNWLQEGGKKPSFVRID